MSERAVIRYEHATRTITLPVPDDYVGELGETEKMIDLFRGALKMASGELHSEVPVEHICFLEPIPK